MRRTKGYLISALAGSLLTALAGASGIGAQTQAAPANASRPTVSGNPQEGSTLTASPGTWNGSTPMSFSYQWRRCKGGCSDISGATSTAYTATSSDLGATLRARVKATNGDGSSTSDSRATAEVGAPQNTAPPTVSGTAEVGSTLTGAAGTWLGKAPLAFTYDWRRCDSNGNSCSNVGDRDATHTLQSADAGKRMRFVAHAKNTYASLTVASSPTAVVAVKPGKPALTAKPAIAGDTTEGQTLTAFLGRWTGATPMTLKPQWRRCDQNGNGCNDIAGATANTYLLTSGDVGHRLRVRVAATNSAGAATGASDPSNVIAAKPTGPPGAITLPNGKVSIPVTSVSLPNQLVIDGVSFSPRVITSRSPFRARFHISDGQGNFVRDALVYMIGIPYGRILNVPEQATGQDGWVTMTVQPTLKFPLVRGGSLVIFVRARKPGENLLKGVAARRLVQVRTGARR